MSIQYSSRYSLLAGRNLPDKEFRYLRTVIVTAAVHRGFASPLLARLRLTFRHWAGVSPYTSACALAETCVFGKQSLEPVSCDPLALSCITQEKATRAPLLPKVRGQFAEFLDRGCPGSLRLSVWVVLSPMTLLIPAFALVCAPPVLAIRLPCPHNAPLPCPLSLSDGERTSRASVRCLSLDTLSVRAHSTSELLRTLSMMAASKPTSWLSGRTHGLAH